MLKMTILGVEMFDENNNEFITPKDIHIELEHSLVSLSKWEEIYEVPFMSGVDLTNEQMFTYVKCMTLTPDIPNDVYLRMSNDNLNQINTYISRKMTATTVFEASAPNKPSRKPETVTSELIYYWMTCFNIPFECQHWHLNKLMTLIKVCNVKNSPDKKMSQADRAAWMREQNELRMKANNTSG